MLHVSVVFFKGAASMVFLEASVWDHVTKCFARILCIYQCNCKSACLAQIFIYSDSMSVETVNTGTFSVISLYLMLRFFRDLTVKKWDVPLNFLCNLHESIAKLDLETQISSVPYHLEG